MKRTVEIESLKNLLSNFEPDQCNTYGYSCIILLEHLNHRSGVSMQVGGDCSTEYCLKWSTKPLNGGMKDKHQLTEDAALVIAFFLALAETEYSFIEQADQGTGIDYWLGYDEVNFMQARLEVSGIMNNLKRVKYRKKRKHNQAEEGTSRYTGLPVYVVVAEFGTPFAMLTKELGRYER